MSFVETQENPTSHLKSLHFGTLKSESLHNQSHSAYIPKSDRIDYGVFPISKFSHTVFFKLTDSEINELALYLANGIMNHVLSGNDD